LPAQSLSVLSPEELKTIFYGPNFLDSSNLEGHVPVFISPINRVTQLYPGALGSLLVVSYVKVKVQITRIFRPAVSRPVRPGVRHPSGKRDQFLVLLSLDALSDEKLGL
jgi:hypothetical protein